MSKAEWVSIKKYEKPDSLFTGQLGRIEGVSFIRSSDWMELLFKETSRWDRDRHYHQLIEQYQGMEIEAGRSPESTVPYYSVK